MIFLIAVEIVLIIAAGYLVYRLWAPSPYRVYRPTLHNRKEPLPCPLSLSSAAPAGVGRSFYV